MDPLQVKGGMDYMRYQPQSLENGKTTGEINESEGSEVIKDFQGQI